MGGLSRKLRVFHDQPNHIHAEAVHAALQPEAQHIQHRRAHLGVAPVQFRLLFDKLVQVILPGGWRPTSQAGPPKKLPQLLGGEPSGLASRQMYQSRLGLSRLERDSMNQGCWSEVWLGT